MGVLSGGKSWSMGGVTVRETGRVLPWLHIDQDILRQFKAPARQVWDDPQRNVGELRGRIAHQKYQTIRLAGFERLIDIDVALAYQRQIVLRFQQHLQTHMPGDGWHPVNAGLTKEYGGKLTEIASWISVKGKPMPKFAYEKFTSTS